MVRMRGSLAATLLAILAASCGGRPSVTIMVAGEIVPTQVVSTTEGTPCSTKHGDGPFPTLAPTIVREPTPLAIRVDAEPGSEIRGRIYEIDTSAPTMQLLPASGPLEQFTLTSGVNYPSRSIVATRTYQVSVDVSRSVLGFRSEVTHAFNVRVQPP
jgi:hypothetical protein